jgi:hypothetical protein
MSTDDVLETLAKARRLHRYTPAFVDPDYNEARRLYMTEEAFGQCPPSGMSTHRDFDKQILVNIRGQISDFLSGAEMYEGQDLTHLEPLDRNVWELRVFEKPQARLFGWFVARDRLIVTHSRLRNNLDFSREIAKTESIRKNFVELPILDDSSFHRYVSNGVPCDEQ